MDDSSKKRLMYLLDRARSILAENGAHLVQTRDGLAIREGTPVILRIDEQPPEIPPGRDSLPPHGATALPVPPGPETTF